MSQVECNLEHPVLFFEGLGFRPAIVYPHRDQYGDKLLVVLGPDCSTGKYKMPTGLVEKITEGYPYPTAVPVVPGGPVAPVYPSVREPTEPFPWSPVPSNPVTPPFIWPPIDPGGPVIVYPPNLPDPPVEPSPVGLADAGIYMLAIALVFWLVARRRNTRNNY